MWEEKKNSFGHLKGQREKQFLVTDRRAEEKKIHTPCQSRVSDLKRISNEHNGKSFRLWIERINDFSAALSVYCNCIIRFNELHNCDPALDSS